MENKCSTQEIAAWTPTQLKMIKVLADGESHAKYELYACLNDDLSPMSNIRAHLTAIRKKLRPLGQDIVCVYNQKQFRYLHIRRLNP